MKPAKGEGEWIDLPGGSGRVLVRTGFPRWLRVLLLPKVLGITLGRRIYISESVQGVVRERLLRHELEHARQILRNGPVRFVRRYLAEYLRARTSGLGHGEAYRRISFEIEAREAEKGPSFSDREGCAIESGSGTASAVAISSGSRQFFTPQGRLDMHTYETRTFDLSGLKGISDETLEIHFKLYDGYVKNTNSLNEQIAQLIRGGLSDSDKVKFSELVRRKGFEYNGMVLHEYYFGNMKKSAEGDPASGNQFRAVAENTFDGFDAFKKEFSAMGGMRGIGWVICYQDLSNGALSNHWVDEHQDGNIAGFAPILVMDVWEHAFLRDYKPAEKGKYIEAFISNVDWDVVAGRLSQPDGSRR